MQSQMPKSIGVIVVGAVLGIVLWADAGNLNPPVGAPGSTMLTLQEIGDKVDHVSQQVGSIQSTSPAVTVWQYAHLQSSVGQVNQLVAGSGILHGVWYSQNDIALFDGHPNEGGVRIAQGHVTTNTVSSVFMQLDVRFENGLYVNGGYHITALYRPDTP